MPNRSKTVRSWMPALLASVLALVLFAPAHFASAQDADTLSVDLAAEGDIGVTGTAVFTADGDQTLLSLQLDAGEAGYEGHIFDSTCDDHQGATVFYTVEPVDENLTSESVLDVSFEEITNGDYWIHIHKPGGERGTGVSCSQITTSTGVGGALPAAGVGPIGSGGSGIQLLLGLAAAGLFGVARQLLKEASAKR